MNDILTNGLGWDSSVSKHPSIAFLPKSVDNNNKTNVQQAMMKLGLRAGYDIISDSWPAPTEASPATMSKNSNQNLEGEIEVKKDMIKRFSSIGAKDTDRVRIKPKVKESIHGFESLVKSKPENELSALGG